MTLEQLKMLVTVADTGSLKQASERLFKTQPAISQGLAKLESQLGVTLFDRESYRLTLTPTGTVLYQQARRILNESERMSAMAKHFVSGHEPQVSLAFEGTFDLSHLLPILERVQQDAPKTQITLTQEFISGAWQKLLAGQVDIAITPISQELLESESVTSVLVAHGALISVAAPKLVDRHRPLSSAHQLRDEYQILVQDTGTASMGKDMGVKDGQRKWYANDFSTKKMLILSGMGWGKLPDFLIRNELENNTLMKLELDDMVTHVATPHHAIKLTERFLGPVGQALWDALIELA